MAFRSNSLAAPDRPRPMVLARGWRRAGLAILAGAGSALALPPLGWFPVLWITLPFLVFLLDRAPVTSAGGLSRFRSGFAVGWSFGFGYFVGGLWWIGAAFLVDAAAFAWLMPLAVLVLPAGLALFWGLGAGVARIAWPRGWPRILVLAVCLSLVEWLRGHVLTGFPWNAFGYAMMPVPVMMQVASLIGVWGVTFFAFLVAAAPILWFSRDPGDRVVDRCAFFVIAALFLADLGFGFARLASAETAMVPGVRLRLVQPVIAQDQKWASGRGDEILGRYLRLSATGMEEGKPAPFTHLIWPETAFPFLLDEQPNALALIGSFLPDNATLITGAARGQAVVGEEIEPRVFNSLQIVDSDGIVRSSYDKVHLVPFGEYLPFDRILRGLGISQMIALPGGFDAGERRMTLDLPGAPSFSPLICYEIIFAGEVVDGADRPGWIVNVTNDGWFGDTPGPWQHLHQATIRAVEEGIPVARSANSGVSAIIDPYGNLLAYLGVDQDGVVDGTLPVAIRPTIYSKYRDSLYFALIILAIVVASTGSFTRTKQRN
ncbi:apolipoprotein N-acyltransferase [Kaistia sp. MMO-174]|uniref:apolipoprotein N-acyltransferase n=1 Tax=Kaistia sp. MMO-174 TaxID=3081256 RepID=UPI00301851E8